MPDPSALETAARELLERVEGLVNRGHWHEAQKGIFGDLRAALDAEPVGEVGDDLLARHTRLQARYDELAESIQAIARRVLDAETAVTANGLDPEKFDVAAGSGTLDCLPAADVKPRKTAEDAERVCAAIGCEGRSREGYLYCQLFSEGEDTVEVPSLYARGLAAGEAAAMGKVRNVLAEQVAECKRMGATLTARITASVARELEALVAKLPTDGGT